MIKDKEDPWSTSVLRGCPSSPLVPLRVERSESVSSVLSVIMHNRSPIHYTGGYLWKLTKKTN